MRVANRRGSRRKGERRVPGSWCIFSCFPNRRNTLITPEGVGVCRCGFRAELRRRRAGKAPGRRRGPFGVAPAGLPRPTPGERGRPVAGAADGNEVQGGLSRCWRRRGGSVEHHLLGERLPGRRRGPGWVRGWSPGTRRRCAAARGAVCGWRGQPARRRGARAATRRRWPQGSAFRRERRSGEWSGMGRAGRRRWRGAGRGPTGRAPRRA